MKGTRKNYAGEKKIPPTGIRRWYIGLELKDGEDLKSRKGSKKSHTKKSGIRENTVMSHPRSQMKKLNYLVLPERPRSVST